MKEITNISKQILIIFCFISFSLINVKAEFQVTTLDNPAPGYLRFTWATNTSFFFVDNYGSTIYNTSIPFTSNNFCLLRNGNWAQLGLNKIYIYNQQIQIIDSIPNPTMGLERQLAMEWHDIKLLANGHYLILMSGDTTVDMSKIIENGKPNTLVLYNVLVETDRNGQIYWSWNAFEHYDILDITPDNDLTQPVIDMTHINSICEDNNGDIYVSLRHLDEVTKIKKSTGEIIWRLGGSKCKNNQFTFIDDDQNGFFGFSHQHSIRITDNNDILLYDNGNMKDNPYSRAVEYHLDIDNKTATKVWEYRNTPDIFQGAMGNVERLPNGNTLINWGQQYITEVTPENKVVFNLKYSDDVLVNVYSACKVVSKMDAVMTNISSIGSYDFNDSKNSTGININVKMLYGSGNTSIEKHYYSPIITSFNDSTCNTVLPYRWVLNKTGINNLSGTIKIKINLLNGISNPKKVSIYQRDKETEGNFRELKTDYNISTNEIFADFTGFGEFIIGTNYVTTPILQRPENGSTVLTNGNITWNQSLAAKYYQIQFDTSSSFSHPCISQILNRTSTFEYSGLNYSTKYYWRVRGLNDKDTSQWSNPFTFNTCLAKPNILFPKNNQLSVKLTDTLRWDKVPLSTSYTLQVSTSQLFNENLITLDKVSQEFSKLNSLKNNTIYYWRVRAINNNNYSDWSDNSSFMTIMATPILISPVKDTINVPTTFRLKWNKVGGTTKILLQISKDEFFTSNLIMNNVIDDNSFQFENYNYDKQYFWRIRAVRADDSSEWSDIWNFRTKLKYPNQIYPPNQQLNIVVKCTFSWENNNDGAKYSLQVSKSIDFTNLIVNTTQLSDSKYTFNDLFPLTKYFWRVKKFVDNKESDWSNIWYFVTDKGNGLTIPKLISPKDKSEINTSGVLKWLNVDNASYYRVQISNSNLFSNYLKDTLVNNIEYSFRNMDNNITMFWRVKALNSQDSSDWSNIWSFNVNKKLIIPKLISPANEEMQVSLDGELSWENIPDISHYQLQISKFNDFSSIILDTNINDTNYHYSNLDMNETYYWRVRYSINNEFSGWSFIWSFNTRTFHILNLPKLLEPADGSIPVPTNGKLTWSSSDGAKKYSLSISTDPSFQTIHIKQKSIIDNNYNYNGLDYNTTYFWRISAENDTSKSYWSDIYNFTTELETPSIIYPSNNSENIPLNCYFSWGINESNTYYKLQISYDQDFNDLVFDSGFLNELKFNYTLEGNTTYFYRVKSITSSNYSPWSEIVKFKTVNPFSVKNIAEESNMIISPNPSYGDIEISFDLFQSGETKINLFDSFGNIVKVIYSGFLNDGSYSIKWNSSILTSGVYFCQLQNSQINIVKELIIIK